MVTPDLIIEESELEENFVRASGPGGQNVNKVATAVQLRFDLARSSSLPEPVRDRLRLLAGKKVTSEGILIIEARRFRTQERNRQDARDRLTDLIRRAAQAPKPRRPTRVSRAGKEKRLESKRKRSVQKRLRTQPDSEE